MAVRRGVSANGLGGGTGRTAGAGPDAGGSHGVPPWTATSTYAAAIRKAMAERRLTAADLASAAGYSYEQVRRVLHGEPIVSDQLNQLLCARLSLDAAAMWRLAQHEKDLRRLAASAHSATQPGEGEGLLAAFVRLDAADRRRVLRLVRRLEFAHMPKPRRD